MRTNQSRWIALFAATVVALYLCWKMLQPFLDVLLWAMVLVIVFYPLHMRLVQRTRSPGWSAVISCVIVIATILLPLMLVTLAVVREVSHVSQNLQASVESLLRPDSPVTGRALQWLEHYLGAETVNQLRSQEFFVNRLKDLSGRIAGSTIGFVGGLFGVIVQIFFVIFTMYYLFRDGERLRRAFREMLPLRKGQASKIFERTRDVISASVYGVLVIAAIQGALGGMAFWALRLPSALLWGVVMFFFSMIPMAGSFVVWVPAAIFLAVTGHWGKALLLTIWGALVIGSVDNFLRPKLVGEKTRLHELLIFFSVLGGLQVFGIIGLVLGPVLVAITFALVDVLRHVDESPGEMEDEPALIDEQAALRNVPPPETA